jgi:hypothetical protein
MKKEDNLGSSRRKRSKGKEKKKGERNEKRSGSLSVLCAKKKGGRGRAEKKRGGVHENIGES